jgi:hypothetical protein
VPTQVERDLNGGLDLPRSRPHPDDPSGQLWDEDKGAEVFPKLARKYWSCAALLSATVVGLVDFQSKYPSHPMLATDYGNFGAFLIGAPALLLALPRAS